MNFTDKIFCILEILIARKKIDEKKEIDS